MDNSYKKQVKQVGREATKYVSEELGGEQELARIIPPQIQNQYNKVKRKVEESVKNFERRNRASTGTVFLMLSVAWFYDSLQAGASLIIFDFGLLSMLIGIWSWLTFYVWTSILGWGFADTAKKAGVKLLQSKKFLKKLAYFLPFVSFIPILNFGPEIFMSTFFTIAIVKSEDFIYNTSKGKVDAEIIKEGVKFFNVFRDTYNV